MDQPTSTAARTGRSSPSGGDSGSHGETNASPRALGDRVRSLRLPPLQQRRSVGGTLAWVLCLLLGIAVAYLGYRQFTGDKPADDSASAPAKPASDAAEPSAKQTPAAASAAAIPDKGNIALQAKGYVIAAHQILVSPKVSGMILSLSIEEGKRVKKGDVLAILESTDYQADFDRAKATVRLQAARLEELENGPRAQEIKKARADLEEAEATLAQLKLQYEREVVLVKNETVTQQQFEETRSKFRAAEQRVAGLSQALSLLEEGTRREQIEQARAELEQARADAVKAEWRLGNCTITAPISGTILKKNAEEGNLVNPIAFNGSFSLCELADLSDLEVELNIQERDISLVHKGQKCKVSAEAFPDRVYEGVVSRLMPIADRAKGAVPVRVKLTVPKEEEGIYLKPEMGAIVTFLKTPQPED